MDRVTEDPPPESTARSYSFTWWMQAIYLILATITFSAAVFLVTRTGTASPAERSWHWVEAIALSLTGIYFAASAFISCILFDEYSVIVRGLFLSSSLPRGSIQWFSLAKSRWMTCTVLYSDESEMKKLIIVHCYRFDDEWLRWIASIKRLPS